MAETKNKKGYFEKFFEATKEEIRKLKKPIIKNKLKRIFEAAYDDAENKKIDADSKLISIRGDFESFDINEVLEQRNIISECERLQKLIIEEYEAAFGKKMNIRK